MNTREQSSINLAEKMASIFSVRLRNAELHGAVSDPREIMMVRATDYAIELHASISNLFLIGHRGSGAAMLRALLEGALNGLYLLHLPDRDEASAIKKGERNLPNSSAEVFDACAKIPSIGDYIKKIVGERGNRQQMTLFHKLAHGDIEQLNERKLGSWRENFSEIQVNAFLTMADFLLLAVMDAFSHAIQDVELGELIRSERDRMAAIYSIELPDHDPRSPAPAWRV